MHVPIDHLTDGPDRGADERRPPTPGWPLERVLFALAGTVSLTAGTLAVVVSRWFGLLAVVVGLNQWLYVRTGSCPTSVLLRRTCRRQSAMADHSDRAGARVAEVTV